MRANQEVGLIESLGLTREEVGRRVARSRVAVSNLIRLLELPDEALEMLFERLCERIEPVNASDEVVEGLSGPHVFDAKRNDGHAGADGPLDLFRDVGRAV